MSLFIIILLAAARCKGQSPQESALRDEPLSTSHQELKEIAESIVADLRTRVRDPFLDRIEDEFARAAFVSRIDQIIDEKINGPEGIMGWITRDSGSGQSGSEWSECLAQVEAFADLTIELDVDHGLSEDEFCRHFRRSFESYLSTRTLLKEKLIREQTVVLVKRSGSVSYGSGRLSLPFRFNFDAADQSLLSPVSGELAVRGAKVYHLSSDKFKKGDEQTYCAQQRFTGTTNWHSLPKHEMTSELRDFLRSESSPFADEISSITIRSWSHEGNSFSGPFGYEFASGSWTDIRNADSYQTICVGMRTELSPAVSILISRDRRHKHFFLSRSKLSLPEAAKICRGFGGGIDSMDIVPINQQVRNQFPILRTEYVWRSPGRIVKMLASGQGDYKESEANQKYYMLCKVAWFPFRPN